MAIVNANEIQSVCGFVNKTEALRGSKETAKMVLSNMRFVDETTHNIELAKSFADGFSEGAKAGKSKGMLIGVCATIGVAACVAIGVGIYNHAKKKKSQEESK